MKHVRTFENVNDMPEVGDYVVILYVNKYSEESILDEMSDYINNTVGVVNSVNHDRISVKYDNVPYKLRYLFDYEDENLRTHIPYDNIVCYGKTEEEVKLKLNSLKYNL